MKFKTFYAILIAFILAISLVPVNSVNAVLNFDLSAKA